MHPAHSRINRAYDAAIDGDPATRVYGTEYTVAPGKKLRARCACGGGSGGGGWLPCATLPPLLPPSAGVKCADSAEKIARSGVRLLIGVFSAPGEKMRQRRFGVRSTWMRWDGMGRSAVTCFTVGTAHLRGARETEKLSREAAEFGDIALLSAVAEDAKFGTIHKLYEWWRLASRMTQPADGTAPSVRHVVKTDDDSFVNLPALELALTRLGCYDQIYYGAVAHAGYNPLTFTKCGFSYDGMGRPYRRFKCAAAGAHPPMPFAMGAFILLATPLVRHVADSAAVAEFARRASAGRHTDEDVATGFWLGEAHRARVLNVTYVRANPLIPNIACYHKNQVYRVPGSGSVAVHFVKTVAAMRYVWGIIHDGRSPNASECRKATGDSRL